MVHLKKGQRFINVFDSPTVHKIYEGTIAWIINEDPVHPHQVETTNYLYVTKGREWIIRTQHWAHNATPANADDTNLDGTWCVTNSDHATLILGGG